MLNLSDKELDRFSQEAAQEYEPGDVLGPRSWERLEVRMTQEFGRPGWNPIRHIRRFPFYYAPALLLLLGVGYYLVRPGVSSGSSPGTTTAKAAAAQRTAPAQATTSLQKSANTDKTTSTPATSSSSSSVSQGDGTSAAAPAPGGASAPSAAPGRASVAPAAVPGGTSVAPAAPGGAPDDKAVASGARASGKAVGTRTRSRGNGAKGNGRNPNNNKAAGGDDDQGSVNGSPGTAAGTSSTATTRAERELSLAYVQRPRSLAKRGVIGDSALRAFNAKSGVQPPIKKKGIYEINRKWQFGLTIAPDFASVNSLAGDKAGSSIGLTVDYLFAPHWYVSTGLLATRKNYAARNQDYHAPPGFYQQNNIYSGGVTIVKGSFYMLEIPLNLRYDFSVAGNTLFFISAGSSSYFMTTENANLYWRHLSRDECSSLVHLPSHGTNLFSTVNLSAGVETGLSNSLSLLVAPYMKLPTKKLGLGQVEMNSVGIDFTLKWAPVTSRKRR